MVKERLTMKLNSLKPLDVSFFDRDTSKVAQDLLGCFLVRRCEGQDLVGRIVETEAYKQDDPACHAYNNYMRMQVGKSIHGRSALLFGAPGKVYVYLNYGIHWLFNIVTESEGTAGAVLIRALEPVIGISEMRNVRPGVKVTRQLTNGPGKLTKAMMIGPEFNGMQLPSEKLYIASSAEMGIDPLDIKSSVRIGISKGIDKPWRYYISGNPFVSV